MWNERQRTQKIHFELERVKRELREQDEALEELMREHFVTPAELDAADAELSHYVTVDETSPEEMAPRPVLLGGYVVRG
jgi:hypothetical protein